MPIQPLNVKVYNNYNQSDTARGLGHADITRRLVVVNGLVIGGAVGYFHNNYKQFDLNNQAAFKAVFNAKTCKSIAIGMLIGTAIGIAVSYIYSAFKKGD